MPSVPRRTAKAGRVARWEIGGTSVAVVEGSTPSPGLPFSRGQFMKADYDEYLAFARELDELSEGDFDGPVGDAIRDKMDAPWYRMTFEERMAI